MRRRSQPTRRMRTQTCPPRTRAAPRSRPQNPLAKAVREDSAFGAPGPMYRPVSSSNSRGTVSAAESGCGVAQSLISYNRSPAAAWREASFGRCHGGCGAARGVVRTLSRRLRRGARRRSGAVTEAAAWRRGLAGTKRETAARRRQQAKADGADAARRGRAAEASSGDCGVAQGGGGGVIRGARRGDDFKGGDGASMAFSGSRSSESTSGTDQPDIQTGG